MGCKESGEIAYREGTDLLIAVGTPIGITHDRHGRLIERGVECGKEDVLFVTENMGMALAHESFIYGQLFELPSSSRFFTIRKWI